MKKVYLILPPFPFVRKEKILPLNLGYLASVIPMEYRLEIFDANTLEFAPSQFLKSIAALDAEALLFTAHTYQIPFVAKAVKIAKAGNPRLLTVLGGPHATALPLQTLTDHPQLDAIVIGEGEYTLPALLHAWRNNERWDHIAGLAFQDKNGPHLTATGAIIDNLDALPLPAWELFDIKRYTCFYPLTSTSIPILTARGCPYQCRFCNRALGNRMRYRTLESVNGEIDRALSLSIFNLEFSDETFTLRKDRALAVCEHLIDVDPAQRVRWVTQTRVDLLDEEIALAMRRSGCTAINFGLESGSERVLSSHCKGITLPQMHQAVALCRRHRIKVLANVILGSPQETAATLRETKQLIFSLRPDRLAVNQLIAFPGTDYYRAAKAAEEGLCLLHEDWSRYHPQFKTNLRLPFVSQRRLSWTQFTLYFRFYLFHAEKGTLRSLLGWRALVGYFGNMLKRLIE